MSVEVSRQGRVTVVTINRPEVRNAVNQDAADRLAEVFAEFDADSGADVAVLTGAEGVFCAGADLKAVSAGERPPKLREEGNGPLGCSRMLLSKPVIAAVEGFAVAGGLERARRRRRGTLGQHAAGHAGSALRRSLRRRRAAYGRRRPHLRCDVREVGT